MLMTRIAVGAMALCALCAGCGGAKSAEATTALDGAEAEEGRGGAKPFVPSFVVPEVDAGYYREAVARLASGDVADIPSVDFLKMRYSHLLQSTGDGVTDEVRDAMNAAMSGQDAAAQIAAADAAIQSDYTILFAHLSKAAALTRSGADASFETAICNALAESIMSTGDGRTPETALHVAQVEEEYAILTLLSLHRDSQALVRYGDRAFDVLEVHDDKGEKQTLYFDITEHMANLARLMGGADR